MLIWLYCTGSIGIASEGGEFAEIVKKCIFQGKPDSETIFTLNENLHIWVLPQPSCIGFGSNEVLAENVEKLKARYPVETLMFGIVKIVKTVTFEDTRKWIEDLCQYTMKLLGMACCKTGNAQRENQLCIRRVLLNPA